MDLEVLEALEPLKLPVERVHYRGVNLSQEYSELGKFNTCSTAIHQLAQP